MNLHPDLPAILGGTPAFPAGPPPWPPSEPVASAIHDAFRDGTWGLYHGPRGCELELELATAFGVPYALTCASGTLAVEAALRAVGVSPGDEVILAAYEYESNFLTVHALGAKPVLVDVSPANGNLAPHHLERAISPKTKAILCSHLHGGIVPMADVVAFAEAHKIAVVEDAAQCPGAKFGPQYFGSFGQVGTLSFGGSKLLSAGRGGAVLFRDDRAFQRAKLWLTRGVQAWAALSELQAAVVLPQLAALDEQTRQRADAVQLLAHRIRDWSIPGLVLFENASPEIVPAYYKVGFHYSASEFGLSRELFAKSMRAEGVAFDPGFRALHIRRSPSRFRAIGDLIEAARTSEQCVKLHHPVLLQSGEVLEQVAGAIEKVHRTAEQIRAAFAAS